MLHRLHASLAGFHTRFPPVSLDLHCRDCFPRALAHSASSWCLLLRRPSLTLEGLRVTGGNRTWEGLGQAEGAVLLVDVHQEVLPQCGRSAAKDFTAGDLGTCSGAGSTVEEDMMQVFSKNGFSLSCVDTLHEDNERLTIVRKQLISRVKTGEFWW